MDKYLMSAKERWQLVQNFKNLFAKKKYSLMQI